MKLPLCSKALRAPGFDAFAACRLPKATSLPALPHQQDKFRFSKISDKTASNTRGKKEVKGFIQGWLLRRQWHLLPR